MCHWEKGGGKRIKKTKKERKKVRKKEKKSCDHKSIQNGSKNPRNWNFEDLQSQHLFKEYLTWPLWGVPKGLLTPLTPLGPLWGPQKDRIVAKTLIIGTLCPIKVLTLRQIVSCPTYAICKHSQFAFLHCLIRLMWGREVDQVNNFYRGEEGGPRHLD